MIEEYKVSLYAQELKTAFPVSRNALKKPLMKSTGWYESTVIIESFFLLKKISM